MTYLPQVNRADREVMVSVQGHGKQGSLRATTAYAFIPSPGKSLYDGKNGVESVRDMLALLSRESPRTQDWCYSAFNSDFMLRSLYSILTSLGIGVAMDHQVGTDLERRDIADYGPRADIVLIVCKKHVAACARVQTEPGPATYPGTPLPELPSNWSSATFSFCLNSNLPLKTPVNVRNDFLRDAIAAGDRMLACLESLQLFSDSSIRLAGWRSFLADPQVGTATVADEDARTFLSARFDMMFNGVSNPTYRSRVLQLVKQLSEMCQTFSGVFLRNGRP